MRDSQLLQLPSSIEKKCEMCVEVGDEGIKDFVKVVQKNGEDRKRKKEDGKYVITQEKRRKNKEREKEEKNKLVS